MKKKLGKKKHDGESAEGKVTSGLSGDYVFGSVSGSLFPKEAPSSSGQLSSLFSSVPAATNLLYVPAPKPAPTCQQKDEEDVKIKAPSNLKEKKAAKKKSVADQQVESRESALQNADEEEQVATKTHKKTKRKAVDVEKGDEEERPKKRKMTDAEYAAERLKLKRTVFVGNLPVNCSKKTLKFIFKDKGPIESMRFRSLIREDPGVSRKVATIHRKVHAKVRRINAYVVFKDEEAVEKALEINGTEVEEGFYLRVDRVSQHSAHDHKRSIFVGNLPFDISELPLRQHFEECGAVESVRLVRDRDSGMGKGFGYILFESPDSVQLALKLQGSTLQGRTIRVNRSVTKEKAIKMSSKKGPPGRTDKGPNKGRGKGERETKGTGGERGPNKQGFKRRPGQGPPNKFTGKPFSKNESPKASTSSSSFKGEMVDPTRKPKKKGLKTKLKPRKRNQAIHI